jgi:hypothetical protein
MNRTVLLIALVVLAYTQAIAFCGFYVAKADAKLFNKSSQVILVRDGDHTVITMSNDFQGDVKDFAIVVPVPVVLEESDIRIVNHYIFDKFDAYTAPRMVEYWDENPCQERYYMESTVSATRAGKSSMMKDDMVSDSDKSGVTIEARYTVGEYDILLLSAKESGGLKTWLTDNGYKLPSGAEEVLDPYIKDGTKFFVAKVNLEAHRLAGTQNLRPIQIQFTSPKFMLPIRLGMANANGAQDLIVYGFTRKGRIETSNYRTTKLPTDREIPEFVLTQGIFGDFYKSLFDRSWRYEGRNSVMLEYAWDISAQQPVKCDPCPTPLVTFAELREAGVWWIEQDSWGGYTGDVFVTRLHARYSRDRFPQDLQFIATPNKQNFQGRYVVRHPAQGPFDCEKGKDYQAGLQRRRRNEVQELASLTGWDESKYAWYYGGESPTGKTTPKSKTPDTSNGTSEGGIGNSDPNPLPEIAMPDETPTDTELVEGSADFIARAKTEAGAKVPQRYVLLAIAAAFFAGGLAFRFSRRTKKSA